MQEKSGEKLNIFSFSATSFIAMDRYESVDLFQAPVNSNISKILLPPFQISAVIWVPTPYQQVPGDQRRARSETTSWDPLLSNNAGPRTPVRYGGLRFWRESMGLKRNPDSGGFRFVPGKRSHWLLMQQKMNVILEIVMKDRSIFV